MSLSPGTRLGPYEIEALIGSGGMGEVYRARDTRLERRVAIKVLPPEVAADPERRERFEREARTIASLSHPHICVLHDVGHDHESTFLVMEELAGETLAERLKAGPLPLDQALRYGIEILEALDQAHRHGIVHRDLKPGNVFLAGHEAATTSSQRERRRSSSEFVKLLDFGLAKVQTSAFVPAGLSQAVTGNRDLTGQGTILGTIQYMAPEQLEGREVDARTDLFAFGSVLYEMVTGRRAFEGKSQVGLMAAILDSDPKRPSEVQPLAPPALDHVVQGCLAKAPDDRWQTARDVMKELQWIAAGGTDAAALTSSMTAAKSGRGRWTWAAASFGMGLVLASVGAAFYTRAPEDNRQTRFAIATPENTPGGLAISPDGRLIAVAARTSPTMFAIYLRSMDDVDLKLLPGTEGGGAPFWSPDSRHLGFFADGKIKRIDVSGGPPQTICTTGPGGFVGATWSADGVVVFGQYPGALKRVSASGGEPVDLTDLRAGESAHVFPMFLPDARHVLFEAVGSGNPQATPPTMMVASLDSKGTAPVGLKVLSNLAYAPPGYLLFHRDRVMFVQSYDAKRSSVEGEPRRVIDDLMLDSLGAVAEFSVSTTGALVYRSASSAGLSQLTWYDRTGKRLGPVGTPGDYHGMALSPDNKRVAVHLHEQATGGDIWVLDVDRGALARLTTNRSHDQVPIWSRDGASIAFASDRAGAFRIYQKLSTGVGDDDVVFKSESLTFPEDYAPDGQSMSIGHSLNGTVVDVQVLPLNGDRKPRPFTNNTEFVEGLSKFSPDGHWLAYVSDESRRNEVYVLQYPAKGSKVPISTAGGSYPRWSRSGKELFYMTDEGTLMAVDVREDATTLQASTPRVLFKTNAALTDHVGYHYEYDVTADGQRFLVNERLTPTGQGAPLTVVLNWLAELKK
jgi:eukaryotic-like serine/threonine-protein kinase